MSAADHAVSVVDSNSGGCPPLALVDGAGRALAVMWPGVGAQHRTMNLIELREGARTIPLQHESESVYYVIAGRGVVADVLAQDDTALVEGAMVHIGAGDRYAFKADEGADLTLLGGPCPADLRLYDTRTAQA